MQVAGCTIKHAKSPLVYLQRNWVVTVNIFVWARVW